eukprot:6294461-Prymnesium_polylepis.1
MESVLWSAHCGSERAWRVVRQCTTLGMIVVCVEACGHQEQFYLCVACSVLRWPCRDARERKERCIGGRAGIGVIVLCGWATRLRLAVCCVAIEKCRSAPMFPWSDLT